MSSQFSYELDERQIRLMMQDAELDYNEALWHKFDEMSVGQAKSVSQIVNFVPKINIGISRSVIVPIIFIILIGGLSAMLFGFVDFKKKEAIENEIPYVAKVVPVIKPVVKAKTVIKPKISEPAVLKTVPTDTSNSVKINVTNSVALVPVVKKDEPVKLVEPKTSVEPSKNSTLSQQADAKTVVTPHKRKSTKKVKTEVLPTINASLNLNEGANEPELELK